MREFDRTRFAFDKFITASAVYPASYQAQAAYLAVEFTLAGKEDQLYASGADLAADPNYMNKILEKAAQIPNHRSVSLPKARNVVIVDFRAAERLCVIAIPSLQNIMENFYFYRHELPRNNFYNTYIFDRYSINISVSELVW